MTLPEPECRSGYTREQIKEIVADRLEEFDAWFCGQTGVFCTGQRYDREQGMYYADEPYGHGPVVYPWDLKRFLDGRPVID